MKQFLKKMLPSNLIYFTTFWVVSYLLLGLIIVLLLKSYGLLIEFDLIEILRPACILGVFLGVVFGSMESLYRKEIFKGQSLGLMVLYKGLAYFITTVIAVFLYKNILYDDSDHHGPMALKVTAWHYLLYLFLLYNFIMSIVFGFASQVVEKFGPTMALPLIMGRYRTPKVEYRGFLFMDLKASTTIAEQLGYIKYSAFMRDCFLDINRVLSENKGEIYQYAGDEIIITWLSKQNAERFRFLDFYFECELRFQRKLMYYMASYGVCPEFKAGAHIGNVMAVEVGEIKRDIAYHGDTINTAARIRSQCKEYDKRFLISAMLAKDLKESPYNLINLGLLPLKGKSFPVEIFSVEK